MMKKPSDKIKEIYNSNKKDAETAHKKLDAIYQYLDEALPERVQLAAIILSSMLANGKYEKEEAARIALDSADLLLQ